MSIFNDDRIVSDDIWEYSEWLSEVKWEFRREQYEQDHPEEYLDDDPEE